MRKITKKMVSQSITEVFRLGIEITQTQFLFLMVNNESLRQDWNEVGDIDTAFRDQMCHAIAKELNIKCTKGCWPTGLTSNVAKKQFEIEFKEKAKKKGYILSNDFGL